ncbi:MAG: zinc ribbon domain-containing protein [Chloroflexota bacterium]|nr:zinc ribbon domain-containing protein [Chloroflexota bacterium]
MPIYEYHCEDCGQQFEKFVRSSTSNDAIECPHCHSTNVQKGFSTFGMGGSSMKGGGLRNFGPSPSCSTGST